MFRSMLGRLGLAKLSLGLIVATAAGSEPVDRAAGGQAIAAAPGQKGDDSRKSLLEEEQALHLRIQLVRQQIPALEKGVRELEQLAAEAQREMRLTSAAGFRETANQHRAEIRSLEAQIARMRQRLVEIEQILRPVDRNWVPPPKAEGTPSPKDGPVAPVAQAQPAKAQAQGMLSKDGPPSQKEGPPPVAISGHELAIQELVETINASANALRAINGRAAIADDLQTLRKQIERMESLGERLRKLPVPTPDLNGTLRRQYEQQLIESYDRFVSEAKRSRFPGMLPPELSRQVHETVEKWEAAAKSVGEILASWPR